MQRTTSVSYVVWGCRAGGISPVQLARLLVSLHNRPPEFGLPAAARIYPETDSAQHLPWCKRLRQEPPGFVCLHVASPKFAKLFLFTCSARGLSYALQLDRGAVRDGAFCFEWLHKNLMCESFKPIEEIMSDAGLDAIASDVNIHRMRAEAQEISDDSVVFKVSFLDESPLPLHAEVTAAEEEDSTLGSDQSSDVESVCSKVETDAEEIAEEFHEHAEGEAADVDADFEADEPDVADAQARAKVGTYTVWRNDYFYCTNDPRYKDVKIRLYKCWCTPDKLGGKQMSKAVPTAKYDDDESAEPVRLYLVLRAWMIMRFAKGGFMASKPSRKNWWRREVERLREDVAKLSVGNTGTGNEKADKAIAKWAPEVLG